MLHDFCNIVVLESKMMNVRGTIILLQKVSLLQFQLKYNDVTSDLFKPKSKINGTQHKLLWLLRNSSSWAKQALKVRHLSFLLWYSSQLQDCSDELLPDNIRGR